MSSERQVTLIERQGPGAGAIHVLAPPVTIGRGKTCTLILGDPDASRHHCVIEFHAHEYVVRDLGSANGTFLNGKRINKVALRHGDLVGVGGTVLAFEIGATRRTVMPSLIAETEALATTHGSVPLPLDPLPFDSVTAASSPTDLARALAVYQSLHRTNELLVNLDRAEDVPPLLVERANDLLGADRVMVLLGATPDSAEVAAAHERGDASLAPFSNRAILRRMYERAEALLVTDAFLDERLFGAESASARAPSLLCAPIVHRAQVFGVIQAESQRKDAFDAHDRDALAALGRHAGVALELLRLRASAK